MNKAIIVQFNKAKNFLFFKLVHKFLVNAFGDATKTFTAFSSNLVEPHNFFCKLMNWVNVSISDFKTLDGDVANIAHIGVSFVSLRCLALQFLVISLYPALHVKEKTNIWLHFYIIGSKTNKHVTTKYKHALSSRCDLIGNPVY